MAHQAKSFSPEPRVLPARVICFMFLHNLEATATAHCAPLRLPKQRYNPFTSKLDLAEKGAAKGCQNHYGASNASVRTAWFQIDRLFGCLTSAT